MPLYNQETKEVIRCYLPSQISKHLKGQLGPPISDEKVYGAKNEHFPKLCQEGQLGGTPLQ